ncbi:MauE/DoxX family redox-associated membrane protein [Catellatospora chokoriensis]|uniref:Methylamine utilization protein MauE n=1 Tax=Catellatospora chokoriensis TaxID=310353 RepID=A0A8J3NUA5_9ACTN|nr:MauE/DoxX family redox-associated membrane protein [Catellatospora chokoriensis]GIF92847.1 methylamine utilization protein MauE [Catellatospora chokoriensis]
MYLTIGAQALLGLVFLAAVVGKISSRATYRAFTGSVREMGFRPAGPLAALVVAAESATVALVLLYRPAGFALAALLLLAFAAAIVAGLRRAGTATCRCFGRTAVPLGHHHVWRNALLIGCAAVGAFAPTGPVRVEAAALAVGCGLVAGALIVMLDDLRYLFMPRRT